MTAINHAHRLGNALFEHVLQIYTVTVVDVITALSE